MHGTNANYGWMYKPRQAWSTSTLDDILAAPLKATRYGASAQLNTHG